MRWRHLEELLSYHALVEKHYARCGVNPNQYTMSVRDIDIRNLCDARGKRDPAVSDFVQVAVLKLCFDGKVPDMIFGKEYRPSVELEISSLKLINAYAMLVTTLISPHHSSEYKSAFTEEGLPLFNELYQHVLMLWVQYYRSVRNMILPKLQSYLKMHNGFTFSRRLEKTCAYPGVLEQQKETLLYFRLILQTLGDLVPQLLPYHERRNFDKFDCQVFLMVDSMMLGRGYSREKGSRSFYIDGMSVYSDLSNMSLEIPYKEGIVLLTTFDEILCEFKSLEKLTLSEDNISISFIRSFEKGLHDLLSRLLKSYLCIAS